MARIDEEPKLLWRRPLKYYNGVWSQSAGYYPNKEAFMKDFPKSDYIVAHGPWESIKEPEIEDV